MSKSNVLKAIVAVDLGAKYTGVFSSCHNVNEANNRITKASTIVLPSTNDYKYSTKERTAVRHRLRCIKRFKFARKLLLMIINEKITKEKIELSEKGKYWAEAISGLLRKRGYNRVSVDINYDVFLEDIVFSAFTSHIISDTGEGLSNFFTSADNVDIATQWENLSQCLDNVKSLYEVIKKIKLQTINGKKISPFEMWLKEMQYTKEEISKCTQALKTLDEIVSNIANFESLGHRNRKDYLNDILVDIQKDSRLKEVSDLFGGYEALRNLVGNISNLQLRAERWYFNAPYMLQGNLWEEKRFQKTLVRAYKYLKPEKCNQWEHNTLIQELEESSNIVETLCTIDPNRTIPPYENQNNRRPPLDHTIWLSPNALNKKYGNKWVIWANNFANDNPILLEKLDEIVSYSDRKSRVVALGGKPLLSDFYKASYVLQRVMDFTKAHDKFKLRALTKNDFKRNLKENEKFIDFSSGLEKLTKVIGKENLEDFKNFAISYYREVELMRSSTWIQFEDSLFERADIHPPMKGKKDILQIQVGNILSGDEKLGNKFITEIWSKKVVGRSSVKSICSFIEETIKKYQGEFKTLYLNALTKSCESKTKLDDKVFLAVKDKVCTVASFIRDELQLDKLSYQKINNPFTLAQLFNLINDDRSGFSSTSLAAHLENNWRMQLLEGTNSARCCRLPSDPVRPFDGALRKALDRNAWEVVKILGDNIKSKANQDKLYDGIIDATFLIEQNEFRFAEDLNEIKKNLTEKDKDLIRKLQDNQFERWNSKTDRIKIASKGVCPYTGKELGNDGEIDHIIARAMTTKSMGMIFNSEANLIYASKEGNRNKGNKTYFLNNLNAKYLKSQFETEDIDKVESEITNVVKNLNESNRIKYFQSLSDHEQKCVRHALFLNYSSEARKIVEKNLVNLNQTIVNGTQAWFVKACTLKLIDYLKDWCNETRNKINIRSFRIQAENIHYVRENLASFDPLMVKRESEDSFQSISSHAIDALCVYASALDSKEICEYMGAEFICNNDEEQTISNIHSLFPNICEIKNIKSKEIANKDSIFDKPIFKETIYGSNFLPIILYKDQIRIGFSLGKIDNIDSSLLVTGKNTRAFIEQISKYLTISQNDLEHLEEKSKNCIVTLHIDKRKAWDVICKVASVEHTDEEARDSNLLTSLHYVTLKTPIFMTDNKGALCTKDKILDKKSFTIKLKLNQNNLFKTDGTILLPAYKDWYKIFALPQIVESLGKKSGSYNIEELNQVLIEQKLWSHGSVMKHSKVKVQMSLPRLGSESGIFAINRINDKGEKITQLYNSNIKYMGFASSNGKVDWKKPVLYSQLRTNSISPFKESEYFECENITLMNEFRLVVNEQSIKLYISPSTGGRRQIKVIMPYEKFKLWMEQISTNQITNKWNFRDILVIKIIEKKDTKEKGENLFSSKFAELFTLPDCKGILGKPRDWKINMIQTGDIISFIYTVESSSADMNEAYNKAIDNIKRDS